MKALDLAGCELGVATAATQIEGGDLDTNWHRWAEAGRITDGSSPARASGHWERVEEDTALLSELGVQHYRMGIEWARVEPSEGVWDETALAHYRDEVAGLVAAGVRPLVTLHHFNLPGWLEDAGGWANPATLAHFDRLVAKIVTQLKPWVSEWIPINEPNVYATNSYLFGDWPPGDRSLRRTLSVMSALAHAHIRAYLLIHQMQPEAKVGSASHLRVFAPADRRNPWHRASAAITDQLFQRVQLRAMNTGRFRPPLRRPRGVRPDRYYDFQGVNYYTRSTVASIGDGVAANVDVNDLGWEIYPAGLIEVCRWVHAAYPSPIYITENGTCDNTDAFRSRYLYEHLAQIAASDLPIRRYYHWCFTDNWEWVEGEAARFGIVHTDYQTQERTVKDSGRFYADVIAHHGVTEAAYERWVAGRTYPTNKEA